MTPNQLHIAGLELAHQTIEPYSKWCAEALAKLTTQAKAAPVQGEAVDVVAYIDSGGALYTAKLLEIMSVDSAGCEPLMTVAQYNRIMAATKPDAELIELLCAVMAEVGPFELGTALCSRIDAKLAALRHD